MKPVTVTLIIETIMSGVFGVALVYRPPFIGTAGYIPNRAVERIIVYFDLAISLVRELVIKWEQLRSDEISGLG